MAIGGAVSLSIRSAIGGRRAVPFYLRSGDGTLDDMLAVGNLIANLVDDITGAVVERGFITLPVDITGVKTDPVAGSLQSEGGLFGFTLAGTQYRLSVRVPALLPAKFVGDEIPPDGGPVDAFTDAIVAGLVAGGHTFSFYEKGFAEIVDGYIGGRRSVNKETN